MDFRTPIAKARDEWLESEEGIRCCGSGLLRNAGDARYLQNRLELAFRAGVAAQEANAPASAEKNESNRTIREILEGALKAGGYDGLCCTDADCGCRGDELMCCSLEMENAAEGCEGAHIHEIDPSKNDGFTTMMFPGVHDSSCGWSPDFRIPKEGCQAVFCPVDPDPPEGDSNG